MTYYVCTGTDRNDQVTPEYSKCSQPSVDVAEATCRSGMALIYLVFTVLVICEKIKLRQQGQQSTPAETSEARTRLGVLLELGPFWFKMVTGIFHLFIMKVYNEADAEFLISSMTGTILVYGNQLLNIPVGFLILFAYRYWRDHAFRSYINRQIYVISH